MTAVVETTLLAPGYPIPRIVRGGWQLAGDHGVVDRERAVAASNGKDWQRSLDDAGDPASSPSPGLRYADKDKPSL